MRDIFGGLPGRRRARSAAGTAGRRLGGWAGRDIGSVPVLITLRGGGPARPGRRWRMAAAVAGLAVVCTALGGLAGGLVAARDGSAQPDSSYSLGSVPRTEPERPASSVAGIAARTTPSVVMIKVTGAGGGEQGTGSGFVIKGGYIVTNNHVVTLDGHASRPSLRVYFSNGTAASGEVVGRDPYSDIAVMRVAGSASLPALTLGNSAAVAVGDPVIAVGSPLGLADTVTSGIVSALDRPVDPGPAGGMPPQAFFDAIQTDAPINPGNSGGPLVNAAGQVIGIDAALDTLGGNPFTGAESGSIGLGFAIPVNQARRVILQLIRTGRATHAVIGAALNDGYGGNGAEISPARGEDAPVTPSGPAGRAGLRPGDVITRVGGLPVGNADALLDAIRSLPPGTRVEVTFERHGATRRVNITLGSARS